MDRAEEILFGLFTELRDELREESDIGLTIKAQGRNITLRIRSKEDPSNEKQPFFAIVVGSAVTEGAFRISYKPNGIPRAERQVTIIDADSNRDLIGLVRGYIKAERQRLINYQKRS